MGSIDKIVLVTRTTGVEELVQKFNTKAQANFYVNQMGGNFAEYEAADVQYHQSLAWLRQAVPPKLKTQVIDRSYLPNFLFGPEDLVVVVGQDGLVVNTAKYLDGQLILAINPDPDRIDGILLPFQVKDFPKALAAVLGGEENVRKITMAKAQLNDGQTLYGVNDLFIGHRTHQSARYSIKYQGQLERHSSSGVIVSTGAGSTGWFRSIVTGAFGFANEFRSYTGISSPGESEFRFPWDANYVCFSVREPFPSKQSQSSIVFGKVYESDFLEIESKMPDNGVIFSDGIESDFLAFNSGTIAKIGVGEKRANLLVK